MRESSTIQAFIEEGRRKGLEEGKAGEARRIILLQGPMRFGAADDEVRNRLDEIQDLERLEDMIKRILIASSWDGEVKGAATKSGESDLENTESTSKRGKPMIVSSVFHGAEPCIRAPIAWPCP